MELKEQIDEVLATLGEREQKVIRLRYGLDDGRSRTFTEVAKDSGFDVTRERIAQLERRALGRLRHPSRSRKLAAFHGEKPEGEMSPCQKLLRAVFVD